MSNNSPTPGSPGHLQLGPVSSPSVTAGFGRDLRLRVLAVCAVNGHGGPIQSMATVARHVVRSRVTVASQVRRDKTDEWTIEAAAASMIPIVRPSSAFRLLWCQSQLLRRAVSIKRTFDVIHANGLTEAVVVLPVAVLTGTPVVVWVHNYARPRSFRLVEPLLRCLRVGRFTWLAVSPVAAQLVPWAAMAIVENPIDSRVVATTRTASQFLRVSYLAGTDRTNKGFDLLPAIITSTCRADIRWTVVASPPYSAKSAASRAAWDYFARIEGTTVRVLERVPDVAAILADTDLVLCPSRLESFNRVVAEALANGLPFVASDIPAHRNMLRRTSAGELFSVDDPARAGGIIDQLASDRTAYADLKCRAESAASLFDAAGISRRIEQEWLEATRR